MKKYVKPDMDIIYFDDSIQTDDPVVPSGGVEPIE